MCTSLCMLIVVMIYIEFFEFFLIFFVSALVCLYVFWNVHKNQFNVRQDSNGILLEKISSSLVGNQLKWCNATVEWEQLNLFLLPHRNNRRILEWSWFSSKIRYCQWIWFNRSFLILLYLCERGYRYLSITHKKSKFLVYFFEFITLHVHPMHYKAIKTATVLIHQVDIYNIYLVASKSKCRPNDTNQRKTMGPRSKHTVLARSYLCRISL